MNKIEIVSKEKIKYNLSDGIIINDYSKLKGIKKNSLFIYISPHVNVKLELIFKYNPRNKKICFLLDDHSKLDLFIFINEKNKIKRDYHFILKDNSKLKVNKFYNINKIEEVINIDLEGQNSYIDYRFAVIASDNQKYMMNINHLNQKTTSYIKNRGITIDDAKIDMEINSIVKKGMIDSILNQESKIMMMNDNHSTIKPNMYIDEYRVEAKHGISIGQFKDEELFYLQTRGLTKDECYHLLMKGFLLGILTIPDDKKKTIIKMIEEVKNE